MIKKTVKVEPKDVKETEKPTGEINYGNSERCFCGAPVAKELGQNQVCAKHIRAA